MTEPESFAEGFSDPSQREWNQRKPQQAPAPAYIVKPPTNRALRRSNIWHRAFSRWFDHRKAGHRIRAAIWGVAADAVAIVFWRRYR